MSNREHCATCGQPDNCGDCNHRGMSAENIKVGQTIEVTLPGVREWRIPPTVSTATVTAENIEALRADVAEQIERGGATLRVLNECPHCGFATEWELTAPGTCDGCGYPTTHGEE